MSRMKAFALASCVGLFGAALAPSLHADQWNKRTILTVNEPIQVPGKVLEPGKYVMRLLDSPSNRHIVQIYEDGEQKLVTTILAIPNYRLQPTGETQFGWWETPAGQPKALRSWFYPGDNFGQEFAYPKNEATRIAAVVNQQVPTTYATSESDLTTARVGTVDQVGTERELDSNTYNRSDMQSQIPTGTMAARTPVETAQNNQRDMSNSGQSDMNAADRQATPVATPAATPEQLPRTASPYPMVALFGLISVLGGAALTFAVKRS